MEKFYEECLKFPCRHCGALKGAPCRDKRGGKAKPHSLRQQALRFERFMWEREKTAECPTCGGKGRVPVVGPKRTHLLKRFASCRLLAGGEYWRCQFCGKVFPASEWSAKGDVCPGCGKMYDSILAQEGGE